MAAQQTPPIWVLLLLPVMLAVWPLLVYWMPNHYSGWSQLRQYHDAGQRPLLNSQGPTNVTLVQASGRQYDFAPRSGAGSIDSPVTEVGFDDEGFWVRGMHGPWSGSPRGAVFVGWNNVKHCYLLRVQLAYPEMALIIHDQPLLDACQRHTE